MPKDIVVPAQPPATIASPDLVIPIQTCYTTGLLTRTHTRCAVDLVISSATLGVLPLMGCGRSVCVTFEKWLLCKAPTLHGGQIIQHMRNVCSVCE